MLVKEQINYHFESNVFFWLDKYLDSLFTPLTKDVCLLNDKKNYTKISADNGETWRGFAKKKAAKKTEKKFVNESRALKFFMNEIDFLQLSCRTGVKGTTEMARMIINEGKFPVIILFIRFSYLFRCFFLWQLIEMKS